MLGLIDNPDTRRGMILFYNLWIGFGVNVLMFSGAMSGIIPPVAVCMLTAMGIAESEMKETTINCVIWVVIQYLMSVATLLGFLPIFGI